MLVDQSKIGLTFEHPRVKRETQADALRADGAQWIIHVGKTPAAWPDILPALKPDDVIRVYACVMIPTTKGNLGPYAAQWTAFAKGVHERGATIVEVSTGRRSDNPGQWREMNLETHAGFRRQGKPLPRGIVPKGRRKREWPSAEIKAAARKIWISKNISSDAAAKREIMETWPDVSDRMIRALGESGRNG